MTDPTHDLADEVTGEVTDNQAEQRYELAVAGATAIAAYRRTGDVVAFVHTAVPAALEGQGIGSRLIAGALADVRAHGLQIRADCSFVAGYIDRHPGDRDLLA